MDAILGWPPVLWFGRAIALLGLAGALLVVLLLLIRRGRRAPRPRSDARNDTR